MQKYLLLIVFVFGFVYLHKLQKLLKRTKIETHCQPFEHGGEHILDCVACMNTETLPSSNIKFFFNNINSKHEDVDYYGTVKILKQNKCQQYVCTQLLNNSDFQLKNIKNLLQQLSFRVQKNVTLNSKQSQEIEVALGKNDSAVSLRFRLVQNSKTNSSTFVTVRYPQEDITERLAISLSGAVIPAINYIMLFAFLPGLQGLMQAYMVWSMLQKVTKYKFFPILYALTYFLLSNFTEIQIYRDLYFLCNVLLSIISGISTPSKQSVIGFIITVICVSSEYIFKTKDLVWTSTIVGYYLTILSCQQKGENHNWAPIQV